MVIGEAISEDQLREFRRIFMEDAMPLLKQESGFHRCDLAFEDGGNMAVLLTFWETREHCLRHHSSRTYRQFVAKTQHLLAGNFVVKLFQAQ
jgi:quinol monooxygenase YgiN